MDVEQTKNPLNETDNDETSKHKDVGPPKWRSNRFLMAYLIALGNAAVFFQRVSFSMVIVCMVNHTALDILAGHTPLDTTFNQSGIVNGHNNQTGIDFGGPDYTGLGNGQAGIGIYGDNPNGDNLNENISYGGYGMSYDASGTTPVTSAGDAEKCEKHIKGKGEKKEDGPFVWDKQTQGILLGAVYWGYMSIQIGAPHFIYRFGAKRVVAFSCLLMSVFTMLCHPGALLSPWVVFALRVGVGVCTAFQVPGMYAMWSKWAPIGERATLVSLSFSGQNVANTLAFPLAAVLCKDGFAGGWPSVFHVNGLIGVVWAIAWMLLVADSPETLKRIHPGERDYIIANRGQVASKGQKVQVPWKKLFSSSCFWAIAAAHVTFTWGLFLFNSNLPLYMYEVMNFDIKSNGLYSALPYILLLAVNISSGFMSDIVVKKKILNLFWTRRFFCAVSNILPAIGLIAMSYLNCTDVAAVVCLLVLSVGFTGFGFACFLVNPFDIAPQYAVTITSITNTLGCIPGIITPYLVAEVTKDKTREQWQIVFFVTAGVFVAGTVFFSIFGRTDIQSWAQQHKEPLEVCVLQDINGTKAESEHSKINGVKTAEENSPEENDRVEYDDDDDVLAEMEPLTGEEIELQKS